MLIMLIWYYSSKSNGGEKSKNGPDQDKWYKNCKKDFCSFFQGDNCALEALGWVGWYI